MVESGALHLHALRPKGIEQHDISLNLIGLMKASIALFLKSSACAVLEMLKGKLSCSFKRLQRLQLLCMWCYVVMVPNTVRMGP